MSWEKILKGNDNSKPPEDERVFEVYDILKDAQDDIASYINFSNNSNIENMGFKKWLNNLIEKLQGIPKITGTDSGFDAKFQDLNKSD
jgi:hypothetical protein|tara:strand:- start:1064 stop:1327 length:264 start_codon:yes stop_codon:yes gene_type:complete